ncbi:hypothetical protein SAMN05444004_10428 [Jannaschia faecimaris]|uniref:DUF1178 family protein n=1 Tax=Jannaschia faecimaris TaxID=1244108 RepID=A0A1H3NMX6_9RHOB|nr:DUF1178 family protein [Jannaschia faecimaris]SDY89775.1 hypothetical protein SAMN05444004_10428 [Jannaschia faecimaris]
MIRYSLKCKDGHGFESWFQSADAFDALVAKGMISCAICGSDAVEKALMAPKVDTKRPLTAPTSDAETKLAALRKKIESEATYVGGRFTDEARKLHETKVDKPIYGEANAQQIKGLLDDGVPIAPLPFLPKSKAN